MNGFLSTLTQNKPRTKGLAIKYCQIIKENQGDMRRLWNGILDG